MTREARWNKKRAAFKTFIDFPAIIAKVGRCRAVGGERRIRAKLLGRALAVYPLSLPFLGSNRAVPFGEQHVLWWDGLRGALALALALSLPSTLPLRDEVVAVTFGVVAFSIIVQGLNAPLVIEKWGRLRQLLKADCPSP